MQVSTKITNNKERKTIYKQLKNQYGETKTDHYLIVDNDRFKFLTKGKLIEFRTIDLGDASRKRRINRLEKDLETDGNTILKMVENTNTISESSPGKIKDLEIQLEKINKAISEMEKGKNFIKQLSENTQLQSKFEILNEKKKSIETEIKETFLTIQNQDPQLDANLNDWVERKEIIEQAIIRENSMLEIEEKRLITFENQRQSLITELKELENVTENKSNKELENVTENKSNKELENVTENKSNKELENKSKKVDLSGNGSISKLREKLKDNKSINSFLEKRAIYHNHNLTDIKIRSKKLELQRVDELKNRLETDMMGKGRVKERYYITNNFIKNEDLIVFSRRFRGSTNIESELSHVPRVRVDSQEALKTIMYVLWVAMALNFYLIVSDILGIETDFFNFHSFYWFLMSAMMLRNTLTIQGKDHVFEGTYYYLDSDYIDIQYYDKEGILRSFEALCYHTELLYSDKQNITAFIQTTESDIVESSDTRLINLVQRQQKELSIMNQNVVGLQEGKKSLMNQNQDNIAEYRNIEKNAEAKVRRDIDMFDPNKKGPKSTETIIMELIKYSGIAILIIIVGDILSSMTGIINITGGDDSSGFTFTVGAGIGFILGIFAMVFINRLQK